MSEPAYHNKPLTHYILKSWHQLLTRPQLAVSGFRMVDGVRRPDGVVHEYCPLEQEASDE